jgi:hypothetical protein
MKEGILSAFPLSSVFLSSTLPFHSSTLLSFLPFFSFVFFLPSLLPSFLPSFLLSFLPSLGYGDVPEEGRKLAVVGLLVIVLTSSVPTVL